MAEITVIDPQSIENLRALNPDDNDEFLREIAGIFFEDTPLRIAELEESLQAADVAKFTRAAHSIKGSSSNLGAMALREAAWETARDRTRGRGARMRERWCGPMGGGARVWRGPTGGVARDSARSAEARCV
jgi:hypothetical protein